MLGNVRHMVLIMGVEYVPVDVEAENSEEAVRKLAQFLRQEAFIADAESDRMMVRSRAAHDVLTAAIQAVNKAQEVVDQIEAEGVEPVG